MFFNCTNRPLRLEDIIKNHIKWYPYSDVQDFYKLIYQAVFGSNNVKKENGKAIFLLEYANCGRLLESERLIERISPLFPIVKINLRVYKSRNEPMDVLLEWFLRSIDIKCGTYKDFFYLWDKTVDILIDLNIFSRDRLEESRRKIRDYFNLNNGLPLLAHSDIYKKRYKPCYRIIHFQAIIDGLKDFIIRTRIEDEKI